MSALRDRVKQLKSQETYRQIIARIQEGELFERMALHQLKWTQPRQFYSPARVTGPK